MTNPSKIGRYEIIERVGRGGMGVVYRGRDTVLDREVAIKVMSADFEVDDTSRPRFYREARAAAKLQHRNIVTIFEFGEEAETPFIVMEFLRGQELSRRMRTDPPMTLEAKLDVIADLCTGLHFAHEQGVVHRDVKPANIWLLPDGSVKLLDFGIAKFSSSTMTRQGSVFGSISYMSPEQVSGSDIDGRADVFSAGVVLYELLAGRKPFAGESPTEVLARIMDDQPAPLDELPSELPRPLVAALGRALEKDREKRYRHAADFGADLRIVRSALAASTGPIVTPVDLAETILSGTRSGRTWDANAPQPADSVTVARTGTLSAPVPPVVQPRRSYTALVAILIVAALVVVAGGYLWFRGGQPAVVDPGTTTPAAPTTPTPAPVIVRIQSEPPGASVAVDGSDIGKVTPADLQVDPARLPSIRLVGKGYLPHQAALSAADVAAGTVLVRLQPDPATQVPPPPREAQVSLSGSYAFSVIEGGRTISAESETHQLRLAGRHTLRLRSDLPFLDVPLLVDGSGKPVTWTAPGTGRVDFRGSEACQVYVSGRDLGQPPIPNHEMAAGSYVAELVCPDGRKTRTPFTVEAGGKVLVTLR